MRFAQVKEEQRACPLRGTRSKTYDPTDPKPKQAMSDRRCPHPNNAPLSIQPRHDQLFHVKHIDR